jgi:hypothetical protein
MNLDHAPEDFGLDRCPTAGEGCHGWMYKAAHRLVAAGFDDNEIEEWIDAWLGRPAQPREIANTLSKVRAEVEGKIPPRKTVGAKRPKDEAAIAKLLEAGPTSVEEFMATSPVDVSEVGASTVLRALFGCPDSSNQAKTILFTDMLSQGQLVWSPKTDDEDVVRLGRTNTEGAWFLLNPVTGDWTPRDEAKPTRRSESSLTAYRHVLIEADNMPLEEWLTILRGVTLPIVSVTLSGNASAHAIVRVDAADRDEWLAAAKQIADVVVPLGADPNAITAVRLTRLPGVTRKDNGKSQSLIYFNPNAEKLAVNSPTPSKSTESEGGGQIAAPLAEDSTNDALAAGNGDSASPEMSKPPTNANKGGRFEDIYYDGKAFFMRSAEGIWCYEMTSVLTSTLKTRGCSDRVPKGGTCSQLDTAKEELRRKRRVHGAGPRLYSQSEVWFEGGKKYLNTATVKVTPAAPEAGAWGEHFPRYASVLDNVFTLPDYKDTFLAWAKRFYESAEAGDLKLGQALIMCGPVHCFKTFLIEKLLAPAMGGYADLSSIVSGEGNGFNSELFHSPLAVIDDSKAAESEAQLNRYASAVKKLAAHGRHKYHEKFVTPILVEWKGRVVIAANDDVVSIKAVPTLDVSNEDKLIVLAMQSWEDQPGPEYFANVEKDELPHLLAWLKAWTIPFRLTDPTSRYGIRSIIATEIRAKIEASGAKAELRDTLNAWWRRKPDEERKVAWEGTTVDLHQSFHTIFDNTSLTNQWPVRILGRRLGDLATTPDSGVSVVSKRYGKDKVTLWRIEPPAVETPDEDQDPF